MKFIIMHKTSPHWESGAVPGPGLVARVGALLGEAAQAGVLQAAEGLRATSEGVRVTFRGGERTIARGPFAGDHELPAGFSILRTRTIDDAIEWATRQARILGEPLEIDIRPVTEPWDIGMAPRPANVDTRRYMVLRKATPATESGESPAPPQRPALLRLIEESTRDGVLLATESMRPSRRGRRYLNARDGVSMFDGPFVESKELIAGYIIISVESLDAAGAWAARYLDGVTAHEVDVRELE
jgi:hypothetical protein